MKVTEAWGKEGQHGFNIFPRNDSLNMFGFIEIEHGFPHNDSIYTDCKTEKLYMESIFLNQQIIWTICEKENKYFEVNAKANNGFSMFAFSENKRDIDSLISVIETLSEK